MVARYNIRQPAFFWMWKLEEAIKHNDGRAKSKALRALRKRGFDVRIMPPKHHLSDAERALQGRMTAVGSTVKLANGTQIDSLAPDAETLAILIPEVEKRNIEALVYLLNRVEFSNEAARFCA